MFIRKLGITFSIAYVLIGIIYLFLVYSKEQFKENYVIVSHALLTEINLKPRKILLLIKSIFIALEIIITFIIWYRLSIMKEINQDTEKIYRHIMDACLPNIIILIVPLLLFIQRLFYNSFFPHIFLFMGKFLNIYFYY